MARYAVRHAGGFVVVAGTLNLGSTTVSASPIQSLTNQYAAIAATKLNGVLQ